MELKISKRVDGHTFARLAAILFFSSSTIETLFSKILSYVSLDNYAYIPTSIIVYGVLAIAIVLNPRSSIKVDFCVLFGFVLCFFTLTILVHPEYMYWYTRESYGVWPFVLSPLNGIYGYLFVRLYDDPVEFKNDFKRAGWIMIPFFLYQVFRAKKVGYWPGVYQLDDTVKLTYSISFGYRILIYVLPFLYDTFMKRRLGDVFCTGLLLAMMIKYGSRGPVLFICLFIILLCYSKYRQSNLSTKKIIRTSVMCILLLIIALTYKTIYALFIRMLSSMNTSSRFVNKLLEGSLSSDSGRSEIWKAAVSMIRENPWGYGALGAQHRISEYIIVGYPHSIVLEFLIDYGVPVGILLLLSMIIATAFILGGKHMNPWRIVFLCFFCASCSLFISLSYWSSKSFWPCIAVGVNYFIYTKRNKRSIQNCILE